MKASLNLMKQYSSEGQWGLKVEELVAKVGAQLGAVEEVIDVRGKYDGILIVEIVEAAAHPNADKLNIYQISDGKRKVQVLSNDRTLQVGDKVGWLAPGTTVPETWGTAEPFVLGSREMRGEISHGMFSSGKELGLNDEDSCVIKLDTDAPAGTLLADAYHMDDVIIDIENKMFTHRPDCFGQLGVAREIAGIQGLPFESPEWYAHDVSHIKYQVAEPVDLTVENEIPELVPRYMAVVLDNIQIKPSPLWLQSFLMRVGVRPISNVVDITNYMMILTGQPLHAFDYDKITDGKIVVRHPRKTEEITLLDGRTLAPHAKSMLICDAHKPIAIGGMMGGANSEIDAKTTRVVLECANFDMYNIRRSSMTHGIFTDAVTRFSKGQSTEQCPAVMAEAMRMLIDLAEGQVASKIVDNYKKPHTNAMIRIDSEFVNDRLGSEFSAAQIALNLRNVEFKVEEHGEELLVTAPFWRTDIEIPEDIVEEVGRLVGFDKMPYELPTRATTAAAIEPMQLLKGAIRKTLASAGANELQTYSFVPAKLLTNVGQLPEVAYSIRNAISPELEHYRLSLTPSLLDKVHSNIKSGYKQFALFELNKIHVKGDMGCDDLPREYQTIGFVWADQAKPVGAPYYRAKRYLDLLLGSLGVEYVIEPVTADAPWEIARQVSAPFERKRSGAVLVGPNRQPAGYIGEYNSKARKALKLPDNSAGFELDLERLLETQQTVNYKTLLKFPSTEQDVCVKLATDVSYTQVAAVVRDALSSDARLRVEVTPIDIYQRDDQPESKQITVRIKLQHHDRTMTTQQVNTLLDGVVEQLASSLNAERV